MPAATTMNNFTLEDLDTPVLGRCGRGDAVHACHARRRTVDLGYRTNVFIEATHTRCPISHQPGRGAGRRNIRLVDAIFDWSRVTCKECLKRRPAV